MPSPLPPNASLLFSAPYGTTAIDPETGNVETTRTWVAVQAYLTVDEIDSNSALVDATAGVEAVRERLTGRLVSPMRLPASIGNLSSADASIGGRSGLFVLRLPTQSAWGVNRILGDKIHGTFTPLNLGELNVNPASIDQFMAAQSLDALRIVVATPQGLMHADRRTIEHGDAIAGLTLLSAVPGQIAKLAGSGTIVQNDAWNWQIGPLFLDVNGQITQAAAAINTGFLLSVGRALSSARIYIEIEEPIYLGQNQD